MRRFPHPRSCLFFEQTVFQGEIGDALLQIARFTPQILHLVSSGSTGCVASKPTLPASMNSLDQV
jgi:hypothetical protein